MFKTLSVGGCWKGVTSLIGIRGNVLLDSRSLSIQLHLFVQQQQNSSKD